MISRLRTVTAAACAAALALTAAGPAAAAQSSLPALSSGSSSIAHALPSLTGAPASTHTVHAAGLNRQYTVVLPADYSEAATYPVIVAFGGLGHSAATARNYMKLENTHPESIVVYGHGIDNTWAGAPYSKASLTQDIAYVHAAVRDVAERYSNHGQQVFATGLSNGGGFALALACHAPDLVDGVTSVAGAFYNPTVSNCDTSGVPTQIVHGTDDDVVSYYGGTRHGAPYRSVDAVFTEFGRKNDCDMRSTSQKNSGNTTTFTRNGCAYDTELVRVNGGGHTWFIIPRATTLSANFFARQ